MIEAQVIKIVKFQAFHAYMFEPNERQYNDELFGVNAIDYVWFEEQGMSWTMLKDGIPVGFAGITPLLWGRGFCYVFVGKNFDWKDSLKVFKLFKKNLDMYLSPEFFHRLEAYVINDFENGHRLMQLLGFKKEGVMEQFNHLRKDCALYAKVMDINIPRLIKKEQKSIL